MKWDEVLALVAAGRTPKALAEVVRCTPAAVRSWLRGESVPTATRWRALVVSAGMADRWAELSATRDAVERKPTGRPRLPKAVRLARLNKQIQEVEGE